MTHLPFSIQFALWTAVIFLLLMASLYVWVHATTRRLEAAERAGVLPTSWEAGYAAGLQDAATLARTAADPYGPTPAGSAILGDLEARIHALNGKGGGARGLVYTDAEASRPPGPTPPDPRNP